MVLWSSIRKSTSWGLSGIIQSFLHLSCPGVHDSEAVMIGHDFNQVRVQFVFISQSLQTAPKVRKMNRSSIMRPVRFWYSRMNCVYLQELPVSDGRVHLLNC